MVKLFKYEDYANRQASSIVDDILDCDKVNVSDLPLSYLAVEPAAANGIYVFFGSDGKPLYVGKCSARSFIERIPAHFDTREKAWMNSLLKKIRDKYKLSSLTEAYDQAQKLSMCIVPCILPTGRKDIIGKLETYLRHSLSPRLNPGSKRAARIVGELCDSAKLGDIIEALSN